MNPGARSAPGKIAIWTSPQRQNPYESGPGARSAPGEKLRFRPPRKGKIPMEMARRAKRAGENLSLVLAQRTNSKKSRVVIMKEISPAAFFQLGTPYELF